MPLAILCVPAFADKLIILQNDRTDEWIRLHSPPTSPGEVEGMSHGLPLVHSPLEAQSQAKAGEELPLRGIEVLEIGAQVLVLAGLIADFTTQP